MYIEIADVEIWTDSLLCDFLEELVSTLTQLSVSLNRDNQLSGKV